MKTPNKITNKLGGLEIQAWGTDTLEAGAYLLGEHPYQFKMLVLNSESEFTLSEQDIYCFYLYSHSSDFLGVTIDGETLGPNQTFWLTQPNAFGVQCQVGSCVLLVGSLKLQETQARKSKLLNENDVKKISKPWGYELWLTGDPSPYFAFKKIFIKSGTKTSLQYHNKKRETNFLVAGEAILHYNPRLDVPANQFQPKDVALIQLHPLSTIDVFPKSVHRLEAVTDMLLFEVSTPELDDVVRISDDSGRKDGRINSEH